MAEITFSDLVSLVKQDPQYKACWEKEVPAEQALYIAFGYREPGSVVSTVFELVDGHQLVIDRDKEGRVRGIEIV